MTSPDVYLWWPDAPKEHAALREHPAKGSTPRREPYHAWSCPVILGGAIPRSGETLRLMGRPDGEGPLSMDAAGHFCVLDVQHVFERVRSHYVVLQIEPLIPAARSQP